MSSKSSISFDFEEYSDLQLEQFIPYPLLVSTKKSANNHLPYLENFPFKPCYLTKSFEIYADRLRDFKVRKDDVWVLSVPKTGTSLVQNIVSQLKCGLDTNKKPICLTDGSFLEFDIFEEYVPYTGSLGNLEKLNEAPSPRIMKSHLSPNLLPTELWTVRPKMIYITRNPKSVAVSMYHVVENYVGGLPFTLEQYFDLFLEDRSLYTPFSTHVLSFWQLRQLDNFRFLTFEELTKNLFQGVKQIAEFLDVKWNDEDLQKLTDYVSFNNMRKKNMEDLLDTCIPNQEAKTKYELKNHVL